MIRAQDTAIRLAAEACAAYLQAMLDEYPGKFKRAADLRQQLAQALNADNFTNERARRDELLTREEKRCSSANHVGPTLLPMSYFGVNRQAADGHQSYCRPCMAQYGRRFRRPVQSEVTT